MGQNKQVFGLFLDCKTIYSKPMWLECTYLFPVWSYLELGCMIHSCLLHSNIFTVNLHLKFKLIILFQSSRSSDGNKGSSIMPDNQILYSKLNLPLHLSTNTIELTVHTFCYFVLDLLCVNLFGVNDYSIPAEKGTQ